MKKSPFIIAALKETVDDILIIIDNDSDYFQQVTVFFVNSCKHGKFIEAGITEATAETKIDIFPPEITETNQDTVAVI